MWTAPSLIACGNVIHTRDTKPEIHVEVCSKCHPFYTGKQKLVDTGGRVRRLSAASPSLASNSVFVPRMVSSYFAIH